MNDNNTFEFPIIEDRETISRITTFIEKKKAISDSYNVDTEDRYKNSSRNKEHLFHTMYLRFHNN